MTETSAILNHSQKETLVALDELGRGTSPRDGESIATATLKNLSTMCRVLFSTHYQGLENTFEQDTHVSTFHLPSKNECQQLSVPRYSMLPGPSPYGSSGIICAQECGIPKQVIEVAKSKIPPSTGEIDASLPSTQECQILHMVLRELKSAVESPGEPVQDFLIPKLRESQDIVKINLMNED